MKWNLSQLQNKEFGGPYPSQNNNLTIESLNI